MRYLAYPEYEDSGVQWLKRVPEHWNYVCLKWISRRYAGGTPDKSNDAYWNEGDIPWLNSGSVNDGYITEPSSFITQEGLANSSAKWIPAKSLVMALAGQGKTKGMVAQLGIRATCNQSMAAIIPDEQIAPRFLYWWLVSNYQNIRNMAGGEQRDGLNLDLLGAIPCPLIPVHEQTAIADFLDRETGRIDTLVAKKRRLIALLKEKRTALISRTVTRGLPDAAAREFGLEPHTRFKDSGIEWLGELPEGWKVVRLGRCFELQRGVDITKDEQNDGFVPVVSSGGISSFHDSAIGKSPGVIVGRKGTVGSVYYINSDYWPHDTTLYVKNFRGNFAKYVFYKLCSMDLKSFDTGSSNPTLNRNLLHPVLVSWPSLLEQTAIAGYLDRETAKIDWLVEKVEVAIVRLQEYRTALITSAVTGKIDVREAVA